MSESIKDRVLRVVQKNIKINEGQSVDSLNFADDLGADSLVQFELVMDLEKEFGCSIPEKDSATLRTLNDAVAYIEKQISEGKAH